MPLAKSDHVAMLTAVSSIAAFNNWLDLKVISATEGLVELGLTWRKEFGQCNGYLHASIVAGLIDTACGFAVATLSGAVLTSQLSVRFLKSYWNSYMIIVIYKGRRRVLPQPSSEPDFYEVTVAT